MCESVPSDEAPRARGTGDHMGRFRLLSIDGGGIRGYIPALVLEELEHRLGSPLYRHFDVIAGTSAGGILALSLATSRREPRARELVDRWRTTAPTVFPRTLFDKAFTRLRKTVPLVDSALGVLGLPTDVEPQDAFNPKYPPYGRAKVLKQYFGDEPLSAARTRVFVTAYETEIRTPVFFVSRDEDRSEDDYHLASSQGISMFDAAMATSAAPTYFPAHLVFRGPGKRSLSLVDGGVFANNPTDLAHAFLRRDTSYEGDVVVSLGTGGMERSYPYHRIKSWGAAQWGLPAIKMMLDGQTEATALGMRRRLAHAHYYRFQESLDGDPYDPTDDVADEIDDISDRNFDRMERLARRIIRNQDRELDRLCAELTLSPAVTDAGRLV